MPAWKDAMPVSGLVVSCFINTFFITDGLLDYSADAWALADVEARRPFAAAYFQWKTERPVAGYFILFLGLLLPFALFAMGKDAFHSLFGGRRATPLRNAVDLLRKPPEPHSECATRSLT